MELKDEAERKFWNLEIPEEEKIKLILQHRKDQEEDSKRAKDREEEARKLGLTR